MGVRHPPYRMFRIGILSRRVDERAPSESGTAALGTDCLGDDPEYIGRVVGRLPGVGDRIALPLRPALEVGDDQVVLRREVAVERDLRDAYLGDNLLGAHRAQSLRVEQLGRG